MLKSLIAALAVLPLAAGPAFAQDQCLDRRTTRAAAEVALPSIMQAVATKCGGDFGGFAPTIAANRTQLLTRFQSGSDAAWPVVRDWLMSTRDPKLAEARRRVAKDESFSRAFVSALIGSEVSKRLDAHTCRTIDPLVEVILPLPDQTVGSIAGAMVRVALIAKPVDDGTIQVCP